MTSKQASVWTLFVVSLAWLFTSSSLPLSSSDKAIGLPRTDCSSYQEPPPSRPLLRQISESAWSLLPTRARTSLPSSIQEHLEGLGVPAWHRAGYQGQGIKIAILDSGFRTQAAARGKALPLDCIARSFRKDRQLEARDSQHGVLCGEIIHRLAPRATLLISNWEPETPDSFLEAVRWARQSGAQIICCSVIMPTWSDGEGGGTIHARLRQLLGEGTRVGDGLFFASAGNTAQRHWGGLFLPNQEGIHQWRPGVVENRLDPFGTERVSLELTSSNLASGELVLLENGQEKSRAVAAPLPCGVLGILLRFQPLKDRRYAVCLRNARARNPREALAFHLTVLGARLQHSIQSGSIAFPGDGAEVTAVAAVDRRLQRQPYSSCGPIAGSAKPDLAAEVPVPSAWRTNLPFSGTSAAAPQAAALAALIWSRHPSWCPQQVRLHQQRTARRTDHTTAHNLETGYGVVCLDRLP
jgi:hypothetical protein